ncbi:MAG: hypothetical protein IKR77_05110 [Bacteroidales bacterium]|nr:hypothetical protein [Bacteroidales bacterium]
MTKKRYGLGFCMLILMAFCFLGCDGPTPSKPKFDESLLLGYWQSETLHEYYQEDGTGYTWDTADDVTEEEAQPYTWTLSGSTLMQSHIMEMGGVVPKKYTLTTLTATTLAYHDDFGTSYVFHKGNSDEETR